MKKNRKYIAGMLAVSMLSTICSSWSMPVFASQTKADSEEFAENATEETIDTQEFDYVSLNEDMKEQADNYYAVTVEGEEFFRVSVEEAEIEEFTENLPSSVDLSESEYFPTVGNQSFVGNCGYWSNYYTSFTYLYNKTNGIKTTVENSHNPMFGYVFYGRSKEDSAVIATEIGYPTIGVLPVDYYGTNTFSPYKEVWEDAIMHRMDKWVNYTNYGNEDAVIEGPDDPSLKQMKQVLYNGGILGIGSLSGKWNYSVVASENFEGELAIDRCDAGGIGGHGLSIIGYNDEVWIDINYDGEVQTAEMGAFKLVNSWGPEWGNEGFVWLAYDALNVTSQVLTASEETRINNAIDAGTLKANKVNNSARSSFFMGSGFSTPAVRERNTSNCWCYISVSTGSRKEMTMSVTATNKTDGTTKTYNFPSMIYESDNYAWDGSENSTDATMVFDLDNLIEDISADTMEDYTWKTTFGDTTLDEYSVTVKDVYFTVNGAKKYVTSVSKVPLNGTSKTYEMNLRTADYVEDSAITEENKKNVTIYYNNSNYDDANIHYQVGSGSWTTAPGVQMCKTDEKAGYTWKYVVNLGTATTLTACFNNTNGTWDNNNSSDYTIKGAGCYGIKNGVITEFEEEVVPLEPLVELDKTSMSLYVGDEGVITPTVIDGSTSDIVWSSSDEAVATVSSDGKVLAVGKGSATITAKIGEVSASCEVTVEENQEPLAVTLTVGGATETLTKTVGSSIKLDAVATGGSGSYTYKFSVLNVETGVWTALQNFSSNSSYTFALNYTGTKQFAVTVKDGNGDTVSAKRITVKVVNPATELSASLQVGGSTETLTKTVGSSIKLDAVASGGSGSYTYKFAVLNVDTGKWSVLKDFGNTSSYTYSLDYAGTKQFAVTVKDSNGNTVSTNRITVKVTKETSELLATLTANGATGNVIAFVGDSVKLSVTASGGNGSYTYKYVVYNVDTNAWFVLKDYNSSSTYTTKLVSAGNKQFVVSVKDSSGNVVATKRVSISIIN